MSRFLFRTLYRARNHVVVHAREECVPSAKVYLSVLPLRVANGSGPRSLSTSSVSYCESKDGAVLPPKEQEKKDAKKDSDLAETASLAEGKVDNEHNLVKTTPKQEETLVGVEGTTQQQMNDAVREEVLAEEQTIVEPETKKIEEKLDVEMEVDKAGEHMMKTTDFNTDSDPAETATSTEGKVHNEHKLIKTTSKQEETLVCVESTTQQQMGDAVREEVLTEEQTIVEPETKKTEEKLDAEMEVDKAGEHTVKGTDFKKDSDPGETATLAEGKVHIETTPKQEETLVGVESTTRQQINDAVREEVLAEEQTIAEPETKKAEEKLDVEKEVDKRTEKESKTKMATESGKESLLGLLGAMKVEVTNKRKFKSLKAQPTYEAPVTPKPAAMESTFTMFKKATSETPSQSETLSPELVTAASAAASTLPNKRQAESELLRKLRQHEAVTEDQKKGEANDIGVLIADMKVRKMPIDRQKSRAANQIHFDDDRRGYTHERGITSELTGTWRRKGLFLGKRLNIFSPPTDQDKADSVIAGPTLWDIDFTDRLVQSTNHMPRNGFEEMIQWTKEGKLWQYPVNNEAGLDEETLVPFHEHIFLEKHLEEGFPSQGPVRHFMEVVVAGLAKNPHLTVQQKKEHIAWFRDYFQQKEEVLKEADVYLN